MRNLLTGALVATFLVIGVTIVLPTNMRTQPAQASQTAIDCPPGSYNIGISKTDEPLCKIEPTGCPYGDSIPMDMCDKFAPQPEQLAPVDQPKPEQPTVVQCGGK